MTTPLFNSEIFVVFLNTTRGMYEIPSNFGSLGMNVYLHYALCSYVLLIIWY